MMKRIFSGASLFLLVLAAAAFSPEALAAKLARIAVPSVDIHDGPGTNYRVIGRLSRGETVATSNDATRGFYRMKSRSGVLGWVQANALSFHAARGGAQPPTSGGGRQARQQPRRRAETEESYSGGGGAKRKQLRAFVGNSMFNAGEFTTALAGNGSALSMGILLGAEFEYGFTKDWALLVRIEKIGRSAIFKESPERDPTEPSSQIDVASTPFYFGVQYSLFGHEHPKGLSGDAALLVGLAMGTKVTATLIDPVPTTAANDSASGSGITIMPKVSLNYGFSKSFSIYGEAGFRILNVSGLDLQTDGESAIFTDNTGANLPITINLSGPVLSLGVALTF